MPVTAALDLAHVVNIDPEDAAGALADLPGDELADLTNLHINGYPTLFAAAKLNERSREQMPVVEPADAKKFLSYLAGEGLPTTERDVDPLALRASQNELNAVKVRDMLAAIDAGDFDTESAPPIIARDGRILDGHHRWCSEAIKALTDPTRRMHVIEVDAQWPDLLAVADEWHSAQGVKGKTVAASARWAAFGAYQSGRCTPSSLTPRWSVSASNNV